MRKLAIFPSPRACPNFTRVIGLTLDRMVVSFLACTASHIPQGLLGTTKLSEVHVVPHVSETRYSKDERGELGGGSIQLLLGASGCVFNVLIVTVSADRLIVDGGVVHQDQTASAALLV